ncbi:hypothetical protein ORI20_22465 [Mycobacterium sp. CVI_P3]|uniref:Secreted protein n=1 Tax=Mycobacterium pinniadriaticum TaxID=2994102 RepID=A0ABT3SIY5_9MYCO|nr:hypothetical protein [Mycobacterium pinniadriaticum]MCX2933039.1 hypothetical protein [Mycobacterium pinniadriaticum]MCX2939461.1 hypothetical protein [Mycobacterium pinniadriaticum]
MRAFAIGIAGLTAAMTLAAPAGAVPDINCRLTTPATEVSSVAQLPTPLTKLIGPIADIGAPFNSTDSVLDPSLPFRRLIRAGHRNDDWFAWYEHGGITYFWQAVVVRIGSDNSVTSLANGGTIGDTLCAITDGAFDGTVPPYPPGSWAAGSF